MLDYRKVTLPRPHTITVVLYRQRHSTMNAYQAMMSAARKRAREKAKERAERVNYPNCNKTSPIEGALTQHCKFRQKAKSDKNANRSFSFNPPACRRLAKVKSFVRQLLQGQTHETTFLYHVDESEQPFDSSANIESGMVLSF